MTSNTEVDLSERVHTKLACDVDQEGDLDAVGLLERDGLVGAPASRSLTRERLANLTETGVEQGENWSRRQFVHAPPAGGHVVKRPLVVALHELDVGPLQKGLDQARNKLRGGVDHVRVEEDNELGVGGGETGAH